MNPNVETILYADSWYQKDKIIHNGKKEFVNKIINVESNFFFFHSKLLVAMLFQQ
jgi:putative ABC transport system permease protein